MADERTVPASAFFDAATLSNIDHITKLLRDAQRTVDVSHFADVPSAATAARMAHIASLAAGPQWQVDAMVKSLGLTRIPSIIEQISGALMASQGIYRVAGETSASLPDIWDVSEGLAMPLEVPEDEDDELDADSTVDLLDDDPNTEELEDHLERILELPDYEAERLAIALGLTLERVPARMGVALVLSLLVMIQLVRPQLFDSLMQNKTHWQEIFRDAAKYWG